MIWCCKDCVAPKRRPGCHGSCPEYLVEKAEYDKEREAERRERNIQRGLDSQMARAIRRAITRKRS